jgi:F-type H+-transporting ATPase subunit b
MGGMDIKTVASSLILNIVNVIVLFMIVKLLVYKPVKNFMKARADGIQSQTDEAAKRLTEANALKEERDKKLATAEKEAEDLGRGIIEAADKQAEEIKQAALQEASKIKLAASEEAAKEEEFMLRELREKIADMSIEIAKRVLEREIQKKDNQDIIDSILIR